MQVGGTTASEVDDGLFMGGQEGSILEGAVFVSGYWHACAIVDDIGVRCWGRNMEGQLGTGTSYQTPYFSSVTVPILYNTTMREISAGGTHTCGIVDHSDYYDSGNVLCWGTIQGWPDGWNEIFTPQLINKSLYWDSIGGDEPIESAVALSSDYFGTCGIYENGSLFYIGNTGNPVAWSQCGEGFEREESYLAIGSNWYSQSSRCGMLENLSIHCIYFVDNHKFVDRWYDYYGGMTNNLPLNTENLSIAMSVGHSHVCWIILNSPRLGESRVLCEGNYYDDNDVRRTLPNGPANAISVSSGRHHACALVNDGSVYCWGSNKYGQLGQNSSVGYSQLPLQVDLPDGVLATAVYANDEGTCIVSDEGNLYCWGEDPAQTYQYYSATEIGLPGSISLLNRDADYDGVLNPLDYCSQGLTGWDSTNSSDYDNDGCNDFSEDDDDDNDGIPDVSDLCPVSETEINWDDFTIDDFLFGTPLPTDDTDNDGCHNSEDLDDDNDGFLDGVDFFPFDPDEWADNDGDGATCGDLPDTHCGGDNSDTDDDNDGWSDAWEYVCLTDSLSSDSVPIDTDGDAYLQRYANSSVVNSILNGTYDSGNNVQSQATGCDVVDIDDDGDYVNDTDDAFPLNPYESVDTDGDGIGNNADTDDDNDGWNDWNDTFPLNASEWLDYDGDGIGNNADTDDDDDGYTDNLEIGCGTDSLDANNTPPDFDEDSICDLLDSDDDGDGRLDENDAFPKDPEEQDDWDSDGIGDNEDSDDDGDRVEDVDDFCPRGETNWISGAALGTDLDGDGCRDDGEDDDDDGDGVEDADDGCPRGHTGWTSNPANDIDGDGCHETEDYDRDGDGFSDTEDSFPEDPTEWYDSDGDGIGDNGDAYPNDSTRWEFNDDEGALENKSTILLLLGAILVLLIAAVVIVLRRK